MSGWWLRKGTRLLKLVNGGRIKLGPYGWMLSTVGDYWTMVGRLSKIIDERISDLIAYLLRYSSASWDELDRRPASMLWRLADGIGKIIDAENASAE